MKAKSSRTKPSGAHKEERSRDWHNAWSSREKKYDEYFGDPAAKNKHLTLEGESTTAQGALKTGLCLLQYPPRTTRMSWVYLTHGLSQALSPNCPEPVAFELHVQWKRKDKGAAKLLQASVRHLLETPQPLEHGHILTSGEGLDLGVELLRHCMVCKPEGLSKALEHMNLLLLVGITDAEFQYALRVKPELADGRLVLLEALRAGGIFPVSDPSRMCLTRRRDFHRIWENAFKLVREKKSASK